jgi:pimeloyl-ACP methyl ester carboxylesterase
MTLIHNVVTGRGTPPIVFVHGLCCAHADWDAQVAHFAPNHQTVAVDLRGHGDSPADAADCSIERYGADVAELMHALDLPPAILVGHSMGCRVIAEAALQAPTRTAGVIMIDGSQFAAAMQPVLLAKLATQDGYDSLIADMFTNMFNERSDPTAVARVCNRAASVPRPVGQKMLLDMLRYDVHRLSHTLATLRVPSMVLQTTYSNEKRQRRSLASGQTSPYLQMVQSVLPSVRIEVLPGIGHFPQLDAVAETNALISDFIANLPA